MKNSALRCSGLRWKSLREYARRDSKNFAVLPAAHSGGKRQKVERRRHALPRAGATAQQLRPVSQSAKPFSSESLGPPARQRRRVSQSRPAAGQLRLHRRPAHAGSDLRSIPPAARIRRSGSARDNRRIFRRRGIGSRRRNSGTTASFVRCPAKSVGKVSGGSRRRNGRGELQRGAAIRTHDSSPQPRDRPRATADGR